MPSFFLITCVAIIAIAIFYDMRNHRIPNLLTFPAMGLGFLLHFFLNGFVGLQNSLLGFALAAIVGAVFWSTRALGGGDHKLLMALAAFLGYPKTIPFLLATAIAGGVQSLFWTLYRRQKSPNASWKELLHTTAMPYSVAIGAGALITVWLYGSPV